MQNACKRVHLHADRQNKNVLKNPARQNSFGYGCTTEMQSSFLLLLHKHVDLEQACG